MAVLCYLGFRAVADNTHRSEAIESKKRHEEEAETRRGSVGDRKKSRIKL